MTWSQTARNQDIFLSNCILKHRQITRINRPARGRPALRIGIVPSTGRSRCKGEKGQLSEDVLQQLRSLLSLASLKNGGCFFFWDLSCGLVGLWDLPFDWDIWARKLFPIQNITCMFHDMWTFQCGKAVSLCKNQLLVAIFFFKILNRREKYKEDLPDLVGFFQFQPPSTVWLIFWDWQVHGPWSDVDPHMRSVFVCGSRRWRTTGASAQWLRQRRQHLNKASTDEQSARIHTRWALTGFNWANNSYGPMRRVTTYNLQPQSLTNV